MCGFGSVARRDADASASACEQSSGPGSDRPRSSDNDSSATTHIADGLRELCDGCDGGGVRAVGVEHNRHAKRPEERLLDRGQQPLTGGHVITADENRGVMKIFGTTSEHCTMHEVADGVRGDATVAHDLVRTGVIGDDAIEHARRSRAVEVKQELSHSSLLAGGWVLVLVAG